MFLLGVCTALLLWLALAGLGGSAVLMRRRWCWALALLAGGAVVWLTTIPHIEDMTGITRGLLDVAAGSLAVQAALLLMIAVETICDLRANRDTPIDRAFGRPDWTNSESLNDTR